MERDLIPMPVIGGPRDGQIIALDQEVETWVVVQPRQFTAHSFVADSDHLAAAWDAFLDTVTYRVCRATGIMPGRTDRQWVNILVAPDVTTRLSDLLGPAILSAWAQGWAPRVEDSEFWPIGPAGTENDRIFYAFYLGAQQR